MTRCKSVCCYKAGYLQEFIKIILGAAAPRYGGLGGPAPKCLSFRFLFLGIQEKEHKDFRALTEAKTAVDNYLKAKVQSEVKAADGTGTGISQSDIGNKKVSELQTNIEVTESNTNEYKVTGTLKKVNDYSSLFGETEKTGHFLCLKFENDYASKITVEIENADETVGEIELEEDGIFILKVSGAEKTTDKSLKVRYYYGDTVVKTDNYILSELTLK